MKGGKLNCIFFFKPEGMGNMFWKRRLETHRYVFKGFRSELPYIEAPSLVIWEIHIAISQWLKV